MKVLEKNVVYLVNLDLHIPEGLIQKPIKVQYKEDVKQNGHLDARFVVLDNYFERTNDTFLVKRNQINSFIDRHCV